MDAVDKRKSWALQGLEPLSSIPQPVALPTKLLYLNLKDTLNMLNKRLQLLSCNIETWEPYLQ
jgi:hypothetical protein